MESFNCKMVNPLYLPKVISAVMQRLNYGSSSRLRDILKMRLVCKLWKEGLDELTLREKVLLRGLTILNTNHSAEELTHMWNPFPSRILRLKLCYGHDNPDTDNDEHQPENATENLMIERFGIHVNFLQVQLQHANCTEKHFVKVLNNLLESLQGLVVSECVSPHRFVERKNDTSESMEISSSEVHQLLGRLENLKFLKLDDSDCKLKYSDLYKQIIENAPNLQHLEINGYFPLDVGIYKLLAYRNSSIMSLTHLKMDAESYVQEALEILNKSSLPLKYFSLKIFGFGDAAKCKTATCLLHSALQKFSCTLERLELKLSWFENETHPKPELLYVFPSSKSLTKLKRFKLVGYRGQLDFLKDFIALKYLMVVDYNPQSQNIFTSDQSFQQLIPSLEQFYLPLQRSLYTADSAFKKKLQHFMYDGDERFDQKYCGLYQEIFP